MLTEKTEMIIVDRLIKEKVICKLPEFHRLIEIEIKKQCLSK